mmetsp:Transcript_11509/g.18718  ORF Transcript_11509/g.18718 Transcript_11509/m.18718 type:complete len:421 (-) Transcript_11509:278-1540(-)|eukprot:CAMPEP_0203760450 /NCGR_PEP_ID=MMETSP0098-20131031/13739_1 /ASSEMBLY_ACC=CAM_ASM_000208 /TAXON_ID=96639 /ORGANISM=" , Strain NY0313808BC1" /LENGTH=420 /DNA_ID=CAMNT_0050654011 /DNA_START=803 /DNA_END=2065 /DNA_ORIENTATION=+
MISQGEAGVASANEIELRPVVVQSDDCNAVGLEGGDPIGTGDTREAFEAGGHERSIGTTNGQAGGCIEKDLGKRSGMNGDAMGGHRLWLERFYIRAGFGRKLLVPYGWLPGFNIVVMLVLFGFFIFNAMNIINDYISALSNPPATVKVEDGVQINFPVFLICNSLADVELKFMDTTDSNVTYSDKDCLDVPGCNYFFGWFTHQDKTESHCLLIETGSLAGVQRDSDADNSGNFENIQVYLDTNDTQATDQDAFIGVEINVFSNKTYADIGPVLSPTGPIQNQSDLIDNSDGGNIAGAGLYGVLKLSLSKTDVYQDPQAPYYDYTFNSASAPLNRKFTSSGSAMLLEFSFSSSRITTISYAPSSFSSFFGSLGGWMGVCSDGWAVLTLVFVLEKVFLRSRKKKEQKWYVRPKQRWEHGEDP